MELPKICVSPQMAKTVATTACAPAPGLDRNQQGGIEDGTALESLGAARRRALRRMFVRRDDARSQAATGKGIRRRDRRLLCAALKPRARCRRLLRLHGGSPALADLLRQPPGAAARRRRPAGVAYGAGVRRRRREYPALGCFDAARECDELCRSRI